MKGLDEVIDSTLTSFVCINWETQEIRNKDMSLIQTNKSDNMGDYGDLCFKFFYCVENNMNIWYCHAACMKWKLKSNAVADLGESINPGLVHTRHFLYMHQL